MRVLNVNKAVGLASSGVEYAQKYRREVFATIPWVEDLYVFTDYLGTNISVFSDRLGFERSQVLWVYDLVTGRRTCGSTLSVDDFLATIRQPHSPPEVLPDRTEVALTGSAVRYVIRTLDGGLVDRVETVAGGRLVRAEHYDESLNNVEHFHDGGFVRRTFLTPEGRVAAEQTYRDGEILRTVITPASPLYDRPTRRGRPTGFGGDVVLEGRAQFLGYVFERLLTRPDDVVIVDRALDVIDAIYPVLGDHRLYSVVHAEHYDLKQVDDGVLLWNNHYQHVFTRPDLVDGLIVSTRRQQEVLERQLAASPTGRIPVSCIPAGVATMAPTPPAYDPSSLVTAGRLADEKHVDLLVRAVAVARRRLPELRLDVYGEGNRDPVLAAIEETGTHDCVRLMGHQRLHRVLGSYGLYVTASTSEGFGLTLLEAIAEGLPIVGFDVDYGNREMVEQGVNGRLVPFTDSAEDVDRLAAAIVEVLTSEALDDMHEHSRKLAQAYTVDSVARRWERLLGGAD